MATYTITTAQNIDELTTKAGGDTYNINGGTLTIDQDSRVGLNQTTSASLGPVTISASLGGVVNIDGTDIWMIPYSSGTGNVPAWNTVITNNTGTGKLIGVHSSLTAASTATGAAMPATGFIRVKQKSGTYAAGALTGISATADNAGRVGWIEIVGDEASTLTPVRLGTLNITGEWYEIGTTSGSSNQTMQIPNNGLLRYAAGVFIEKTVGGGDYEFYPNAGTTTTTGTEATRGKVVWIDNTGLVRIGNSGAATNGYTPVSGLKVVIGNIFFENCTTAARTANVIPNATIATRYDFTTTGGGVLNIDKCNMAWYLSCLQAYSVAVSNSGFVDQIFLSEIASTTTFNKVGVGNKPTTALLNPALLMTYCFSTTTFTDCVFARVSMATSGQYTVSATDCANMTFTDCVVRANTIKANASVYSFFLSRCKNTTITRPVIIQGSIQIAGGENVNVDDIIYCDAVSGTTQTANPSSFFFVTTSAKNCTFTGGTLPVTNNHPYTSLLAVSIDCSNIKFRNVGTRSSPLNLGSVNATGLIYNITNACNDVKIQRVYCSNTRTGIMTGDNTCKDIIQENVFGDYADAVDVMAALNMEVKGMGGIGALTAQVSVYGTHFRDLFTSTTVGRLQILMNEASTETASLITLTNGASFTSAGGLYMPTIGQTATFEWSYYALGHTSFQNSALVMAGGTVGNYRFEYAIDKNDGNGFSTMTASSYTAAGLGTALNGLTGIDASLGFKLKLKISTTTTNATAITSVYLLTNSSTTAQDYQYPLEVVPVKITVKDINTGLPIENARVFLETNPGGVDIFNTLTDVNGIVQNTQYAYTANQDVIGRVRKASSPTYYKTSPIVGTITDLGLEQTIFLIPDV